MLYYFAPPNISWWLKRIVKYRGRYTHWSVLKPNMRFGGCYVSSILAAKMVPSFSIRVAAVSNWSDNTQLPGYNEFRPS